MILAISMLCTCSFSYSSIEHPQTVIQINEFEKCLIDTEAPSNQEKIIAAQLAYTDAVRNLVKYDREDLIAMGYSNSMVSLVEKFRQNKDYSPSIAELTSAAPTMTFYCSDFIASSVGNRTDVTFKWTFKWSSSPAMTRVDLVGAVWNHSGMSISQSSFEVTYTNGATYHDDELYDMETKIDEDEQYIVMTFPMDLDTSIATCKSGKGEFTLHLNERITSIQIAYGYGHQTIGKLESITVTYLGGSLNFGDSYDTLCSDVRTYYVN